MADDTQTREEVVTGHIQNCVATYGAENWVMLLATVLPDISVSLARLVDAGSSSNEE